MVENANLRAEIRKLRVENSDLLRRVRFADTNAHYMRVSAKLQVGPRLINTPALVSGPLSPPLLQYGALIISTGETKGIVFQVAFLS